GLSRAAQSAALRGTGLLDSAPDPALDRITHLAATLLEAPAALITLIDYEGDRQFFASHVGLPEALKAGRQTPLEFSVCERVASGNAMLMVPDARKDRALKDNPAQKLLGLVAYLGAPLTMESNVALGSLCVIDRRPRRWTERDQMLLRELAALVMREIALRQELRNRAHVEARLDESEEDFSTLANFLPHLAWMAHPDGEIYWYNQRWFDYTGLKPGDVANTAMHPDHYDRVAGKYLGHVKKGEPWEDVLPIRGMDGEYRWFLSRAMPRRDANGRITRWFGANTDITERLEAQERQTLLTREIDHRAKNALAVVQAVVRLSRADDPADFQAAVEGRIAALARSHALLAQGRWQGVDLEKLLREELAPYSAGGDARVFVRGPTYLLFPETAQTIALVLHELATNAAKHGALAQAEGKLHVAWETTRDGGLALTWAETLVTPMATPKRTGFGTSLFAQSIERHLGGSYQMDMKPSGLVCSLRIPARPSASQSQSKPSKKARAMSQKPKVLLVEDDALIAMEMEERLVDMGFDVIGPAATIEAAEQAIAQTVPDIALLDANLRGRTTVELGAALRGRGVRVAFCTGYDEIKGLPADMADVRILTKPIADDDLRAALQSLSA
ncbi:MAG TPA: HWE histidine kinase domain-containing protein, partial [Caulobacterales bacterium]|nr:HWE histidine kinase domain-containing protein [Caulobacterales bacterium]